ncbi:PilW family protein [Leptothrix sp. BB-4]
MNRHPQPRRGLTLVELLVALAIGLMVVASTTTFVLGQLAQQRRQLADARLTLALHRVVDLAMRELRRAGHWGRAEQAWLAATPEARSNPHAALLPPGPAGQTALPAWSYGRSSPDHPDLLDDTGRDADEASALRLNAATRAIDLRLSGPALSPGSGDSWQALTDPQRLRVTRWQVSRLDRVVDLLAHCPWPVCPPGDTTCPPQRVIRLLSVELDGHDPAAPDRPQQLRRVVQVRNDELRGHCPGP